MAMEEVYRKLLAMELQFERFNAGQARVEAAVNDILVDVQALVATGLPQATLQPGIRQSAASSISSLSPGWTNAPAATASKPRKLVNFNQMEATAQPEFPEPPSDEATRHTISLRDEATRPSVLPRDEATRPPLTPRDEGAPMRRTAVALHSTYVAGPARCRALPVQPRTFQGLVQSHSLRSFTIGRSYRNLSLSTTSSISKRRLLPFHPTSWPRVVFDFLSILALLYESISVPVIIAWDVRPFGPALILSWAVLSFWSLDVGLSFITGITEGDDLIMDLRLIARKYLRTWFIPDCAVIIVDIIGLLPESFFDGGSGTLFLRIMRLAKIGRFVRVMAKFKMGVFARMELVFMSLFDKMSIAEHVQFGKTSVKLFLFIVWLNHIGCCLWYYIGGSAASDTGTSWRVIMEEEQQISDENPSFMYLTGLYWSISSMFSGASYMPPSNTSEAIFTQVYIIFSALFVSSLTSSLAAMLIRAQMVMQEQNSKMSLLGKYLQQRKIDPYIAIGVREGMKRYLRAPKRVSDKEVSFLSNLSLAMMKDLKSDMYSKSFVERPIFVILNSVYPGFVAEICMIATQVTELDRTEDLIMPNAQVDHAYVVLCGSLHWAQAESHRIIEIVPGDWLCEVALFTQWRANGLVSCINPSELLTINADAFGRVVVGHRDLLQFVRCFCVRLAEVISAGLEGEDELVSDTKNEADIDNIVAVMPADCREMLSLQVLQSLQQQQNASLARIFVKAKDLQDLESEIRRGQCHLTVNTSNLILRVVMVVVLRLMRSDGLLCVRLGTFKNDQLHAGLSLPGSKVRDQETPDDTMQRVLSEFSSFAESAEVVSKSMDLEQKHSPSYGVDTKYIRRIYNASVDRGDACAQPGSPSGRESLGAGRSSTTFIEPRHGSLTRAHGRFSEMSHHRANSYLDMFSGWDLFTLQHGHNKTFAIYAWVPEADFERCREEDAEHNSVIGILSSWLSALTPESMKDMNVGRIQHSAAFAERVI